MSLTSVESVQYSKLPNKQVQFCGMIFLYFEFGYLAVVFCFTTGGLRQQQIEEEHRGKKPWIPNGF
jgi:hypothetical protein